MYGEYAFRSSLFFFTLHRMNTNLHIIDHPVIAHKLTVLRRKETPHSAFRQTVKELTQLMLYEVLRNTEITTVEIETPLEKTPQPVLKNEISIVLILRAGLGMSDGVLDLLPEARVGHIGIQRNTETLEPEEYYIKLPPRIHETTVIVVDPMLATGGSAIATLNILQQHNVHNPSFTCIVAAPEGVEALHSVHPNVSIYTAALDRELNDHGYILPGLGDAGDRIFGT